MVFDLSNNHNHSYLKMPSISNLKISSAETFLFFISCDLWSGPEHQGLELSNAGAGAKQRIRGIRGKRCFTSNR